MKLAIRLGWLIGCGSLLVAACGSVTENGAAAGGNSAGGSGHASAGTAGVGGSSGPVTMPGTAGSIGEEGAVCRRDLGEYCAAPGRCPSSPDDIEDFCSYAQTVEKVASSCGGTSLRVSAGLGVTVWIFDEAGKLIGASVMGDTSNACFNGVTTFYGVMCFATGHSENICPAKCNASNHCGEAGASAGGAANGDEGGAAGVTQGGAAGAL